MHLTNQTNVSHSGAGSNFETSQYIFDTKLRTGTLPEEYPNAEYADILNPPAGTGLPRAGGTASHYGAGYVEQNAMANGSSMTNDERSTIRIGADAHRSKTKTASEMDVRPASEAGPANSSNASNLISIQKITVSQVK